MHFRAFLKCFLQMRNVWWCSSHLCGVKGLTTARTGIYFQSFSIARWYVQISDLKLIWTIRSALPWRHVSAAVRAPMGAYGRRHMPLRQLAYWWFQSLQHRPVTSQPSLQTWTSWLQYITNVTPIILVSIYHHVTISNILTIPYNSNKLIIINHTALRIALVTPRKSVCTGTVTHSDRRSDNFGQKLIPSDQRYERCVKKLIVVHDSPRM